MKQRINNLREKAGRHKTLIQNFSYLSALQVFNMLLPLITYPYLIRVLGKETYGLVVFAQAIVGYLVILVGFGFNISATKEVSIHRNNKNKINEIVSSILLVKGVLFLLSIVIVAGLVFLIPQAQEHKVLFYLTMWMCLYEFIFPIWYFQGVEKMQYITVINVVLRTTFVLLIFTFVRKETDYLLVPIFNGIGAILAGVVSYFILLKVYKIKIIIPRLPIIITHTTNAAKLLITSVTGIIKDKSNTVIIGFSLGMEEVAYYDLADKIVSLLSNIFYTIGNVVFPNYARNKNKSLAKKILKYSFIVSVIIYIAVGISLPSLIRLIISDNMIEAAKIFLVLGPLVIFRNLSYFTGAVILIGEGFIKEIVINMIYSTIVYLALISFFYFVDQLNVYTIAGSLVASVIFEFANRWYYCIKHSLLKY